MNISELVCTRISHDLIGNIGAFANAVELMEDDDDEFLGEIKSTLKSSSEALNARLKFFRMAFGLDNANLSNIMTIQKICADYLKTLNPKYQIDLSMNGHGTNDDNRLAMLLCMVAADTMIRGGAIDVFMGKDTIKVVARSQTAFSEMRVKDMQSLLNGIMPDNLSLYAPIFYIEDKLCNENKKIKMDFDGCLTITIS